MSQKPSIDKSNFKDTEITIGNAFKFETIIKTNSDFEYQWKKNGIPIDRKSENIKLSKDGNRLILSIKSVDGNNEGEYSLVVGNSYGRDEASFILSIKYISFPGPPAGPLSFEIIDDGNKVVLKCSPPENNGEIPVVEYKFEKSDPLLGKWIVLNKTKVCQMTAVIDSNITNSYRVKAINYLGESEPLYGEIKINKKVCNLNPDSGDECLQSSANPRLPSAPNGTLGAYKTSAYSAFIKWAQPIDFGDSELEPYKIQLFDSKTNNWLTIDRTYNTEALVTGLKPSASYRFRVIAVNKDGDSDPLEGKYDNSYSKPVMIACPPPVLGSIGVNETTATSVKLNWDQPNYVNLNLYLPFIYKV
jgi:titin